MSLEEKVIAYRMLADQIAALEEQRKTLGQEIFQMMTVHAIHFSQLTAKKYHRINIKTSLEDARRYQATKLEEVVDKEKIKKLLALGTSIPDISEINYIVVTRKKINQNVVDVVE